MAKDSKWQIKQRTVRKFNDRKEDNLQYSSKRWQIANLV